MTTPETVFLLDIDNTLIDHDELKRQVTLWVECHAPDPGPEAFWEQYERVRIELGIVDFLEAATRYGDETKDSARGEALRAFLWDFPFGQLLLPGTLEGCCHLATLGKLAVLCDGEPDFQRRKLERIGLLQSLDEVFVFDHKELHLNLVEERFSRASFVMFDDKPRILEAMQLYFADRLRAVHVRHGHYAARGGWDGDRPGVHSLGDAKYLFPLG